MHLLRLVEEAEGKGKDDALIPLQALRIVFPLIGVFVYCISRVYLGTWWALMLFFISQLVLAYRILKKRLGKTPPAVIPKWLCE